MTTRSARRAVSDTAPLQAEPALRLWGVPELRAGSAVVFAAERRFQLLVVLALQAGRWVERDRIAALLWPEHSLPEGRRNLRKVLFKAHQIAAEVEASGTTLRWAVATDVQAFDEDRRAGRLAEALARRRGDPLQAIDDPGNTALSNWFAAERARIDQDWQSTALDHLLAQTEPQARIDAARRWLVVDPFAEPAVAALLKAERERGQDTEARAAYRRYATHLAEELGVEPSRTLRDLVEAPAADAAPARRAAAQAETGFIGRKAELRELEALLARPECQMVTIVGPGGIGKSSLARRALDYAAARYAGGSHWVELQDLQSVAQFVARLARLLGVELVDTQDPVDPLARRLNNDSMLVLDNAEHLPDLSALLERLLAAAPSLHLLVTSRERLRNAREWLLPLQGLAVPDEDSRDLEAASSFDAVRLFEARALAAQHGFRLDAHLQAVIEIVEAVGGMPLAIELAANWARLLPPAEIARELNESIDLLERDPSAAAVDPARPVHVSLRAVLQQSWQALVPLERAALADLSVFRGGFQRALAAAVAGVSMPLLSSLVDRSLLAVDETGRFSMHPLVAGFAAERAAEAPHRLATTVMRHAEFFARALGDASQRTGEQAQASAARIDADFANVMAAWQQAVRSRRADLVYAMVRALWPYLESRGRIQEAIECFQPALDLPDNQPMSLRALTWLRQALAMLHSWRGEHETGLALAKAGIANGEHCGDPEAFIGSLIHGATCLWNLGRYPEAKAPCLRAVALARESGDRHCIAWSLNTLGTVEHALGEWDAAIGSLGEALAIDRELGHLENAALLLNNLGAMLRERGRWAEARGHFEEGLRLAATTRNVQIEPYLRKNLGATLHRLGDCAAARAQLRSAAARGRELGQPPVVLAAERELAHVALSEGDLGGALHGLRAVADLARANAQQVDLVLAAALFGDWLMAAGQPARAAAVWRALAALPTSSQAQRDELDAKWRAAPLMAAEPSTLDEVLRLLASTQVPTARPR